MSRFATENIKFFLLDLNFPGAGGGGEPGPGEQRESQLGEGEAAEQEWTLGKLPASGWSAEQDGR